MQEIANFRTNLQENVDTIPDIIDWIPDSLAVLTQSGEKIMYYRYFSHADTVSDAWIGIIGIIIIVAFCYTMYLLSLNNKYE